MTDVDDLCISTEEIIYSDSDDYLTPSGDNSKSPENHKKLIENGPDDILITEEHENKIEIIANGDQILAKIYNDEKGLRGNSQKLNGATLLPEKPQIKRKFSPSSLFKKNKDESRNNSIPETGVEEVKQTEKVPISKKKDKNYLSHDTNFPEPGLLTKSASFNIKEKYRHSNESSSFDRNHTSSQSLYVRPKSAMVSSLSDASSQTSQGKGFMKSLARQFSFRSKRQERSKQSPEIPVLPAGQQGIVSYEGLVRLFECPGCFCIMNPPFFQCRKGHMVCEKCKIALKYICPNCRQRITEDSNIMMEKVCHLISFPCRFSKFGCSHFYPPNEKQSHEQFCQYRPVHCQFSSQGCQRVLTVRDMKIHVDECHFKEFD